MTRQFSIDQLSERTGEAVERLARWRSAGLIGVGGADSYSQEDVERVGLVQLALRRGISLEAIARVNRNLGILGRFAQEVAPPGSEEYSLAEASEIVGLDPALLRRMREAAGIEAWQGAVDEEHLEMLRHLKTAFEVGLPEEAILQVIRVYADSLERVAEAESRLFHFYFHERLKASGTPSEELWRLTNAATDRVLPLIEPTLLYFHRVGLRRAIREDLVMHLAEEAGLSQPPEQETQIRVAIVFTDLCSFTPFSAVMGDEAAADVLRKFAQLVRDAANRWEGRVVKQIGDAFMLAFPEPRSAVVCSIEIDARSSEEPQFPAVRTGINWGAALYREGDYVGANVNLAARLASEADRHEVLVSQSVAKEASALEDIEFIPLGNRRLKGLVDATHVFRALATSQSSPDRVRDPVCGTELGHDRALLRLTVGDEELAFCCEKCLSRYVAAPDKYAKEALK